ncbi:25361_t:CDS:1, partial [Gigaspora rosea]
MSNKGTLFINSNVLWSIVPSNRSLERLRWIGYLASQPYTRKNSDILVVEFRAVRYAKSIEGINKSQSTTFLTSFPKDSHSVLLKRLTRPF